MTPPPALGGRPQKEQGGGANPTSSIRMFYFTPTWCKQSFYQIHGKTVLMTHRQTPNLRVLIRP